MKENDQNLNNGATEGQPKEKKGFKAWVTGKYHSFMAKPAGRWTVRVLKGAGVVGVGVGGYCLGRKSVKPTTVCITAGETEDEPAEEETAPAEEKNEEQAE